MIALAGLIFAIIVAIFLLKVTIPSYQIKSIPHYIFHDGCLRCTTQAKMGVDHCNKCCYCEPNWNLPNLKTTEGD